MHRLRPDAALVARFRADVVSITGASPDAEHKLGVAVSGGADSLALLLLAAAAWPGAVAAVTIDHGLRPASADEAAFVHRLCSDLGVPHDTLSPRENVLVASLLASGNLQDRARMVRYRLLGFWATSDQAEERRWRRAAWVATAHQRDDVVEGFLMRARRGAGVGGLAAMPLARPLSQIEEPPLVIRPLLGWSRAELAGIVAAAGIKAVADPSNVDPRFDRSRMRALLAQTPELPPARLALAAANLRHAEDALDWLAEREWNARADCEPYDCVWIEPGGLPYEIRRRLARRAVETVRDEEGLGEWAGTGIDRLVASLDSGRGGTIAEVQARIVGDKWHFMLAPPRRSV